MADNVVLVEGSGSCNPYAGAMTLHAEFRRSVWSPSPGSESELRRAREDYVAGRIEVDEFERRVGDVVFGRWSPTSPLAAVLKEAWSDSHERRIASLRGLTAAGSEKARQHGLKM